MYTQQLTRIMQASLLLLVVAAQAAGEEAIRWRRDLDHATQEAAQTNRLVLVHFWKYGCPGCVRAKRDVFSQAEVSQAVESNYVPVKLNSENFATTARRFGVKVLPTDVVLSPTGKLIAKFQSPLQPVAYVEQLNKVAAVNRPGAAPQMLAAANAAQGQLAAVAHTAAGQASLPPQSHVPPQQQRYASQVQAYGNVAANAAAGQGAVSPEQYVAQQQQQYAAQAQAYGNAAAHAGAGQAAVSPEQYVAQQQQRYAAQAPTYGNAGAAAVSGQAPPGQSPSGADSRYSRYASPPAQDRYAASPQQDRYASSPPPGASTPSARSAADSRYPPAPSTPSPASNPQQGPFTAQRNASPATSDNPYAKIPLPNPAASAAQTAPAVVGGAPYAQGVGARVAPYQHPGNPAPGVVPNVATAGGPQAPMNNPYANQAARPPVAQAPAAAPAATGSFGMDGFCPVTLMEGQRWARGDRRWGAVHHGRTYLFAGPAESQKFLANPDKYCPVLEGHDPVLALEQHQVVPGRRQHGVYYRDRIYLFSSEETLARFSSNPQQYAQAVQQAQYHPRNVAPPR